VKSLGEPEILCVKVRGDNQKVLELIFIVRNKLCVEVVVVVVMVISDVHFYKSILSRA